MASTWGWGRNGLSIGRAEAARPRKVRDTMGTSDVREALHTLLGAMVEFEMVDDGAEFRPDDLAIMRRVAGWLNAMADNISNGLSMDLKKLPVRPWRAGDPMDCEIYVDRVHRQRVLVKLPPIGQDGVIKFGPPRRE